MVKNLPASMGDSGSISGSGTSPGEGNGNPFQYSRLGNPMDRVVWQGTVHGIAEESDIETKQQDEKSLALVLQHFVVWKISPID